MFIVCHQAKKSFKIAKAAAKQAGVTAKLFAEGCFQDINQKDLAVSRVTFIGHGSKQRFGSDTEECINGYDPEAFVKAITEGLRKIPTSVQTIDLCGCQIGFMRPPNPSYVASVAEKLARCKGYEHVVVRSVSFEDLDRQYVELLQTRKITPDNKQVTFRYNLLNEDQKKRWNQNKELTKSLKQKIAELEKRLVSIKAEIKNEKLDKSKLVEERKHIKNQIKNLNSEIETNMVKRDQIIVESRQLLTTDNIRNELNKIQHIVTPVTAEIQRTKITIRKLKQEQQHQDTQLATLRTRIQSINQELIELSNVSPSSPGTKKSSEASTRIVPPLPSTESKKKDLALSVKSSVPESKRPRREQDESQKETSAVIIEAETPADKMVLLKGRLQRQIEKEKTLQQAIRLTTDQLRKEEQKLYQLQKEDGKIRERIELRSFSFKKKSDTSSSATSTEASTPTPLIRTQPESGSLAASLPTALPVSLAESWNKQVGPQKDWSHIASPMDVALTAEKKQELLQAIDLLINPEKLRALLEEKELQEVIQRSIQDARAQTREDLRELSQKYGFTCQDVSGDGSCFFHAVADQLAKNNILIDAKQLREIAVQHILDHQTHYQGFIANPNEYIRQMIKERSWADGIIISALSDALNVSLVILNSDGSKPVIFKTNDARCVLYLGYEVGLHYQSLHLPPGMPLHPQLHQLLDQASPSIIPLTPAAKVGAPMPAPMVGSISKPAFEAIARESTADPLPTYTSGQMRTLLDNYCPSVNAPILDLSIPNIQDSFKATLTNFRLDALRASMQPSATGGAWFFLPLQNKNQTWNLLAIYYPYEPGGKLSATYFSPPSVELDNVLKSALKATTLKDVTITSQSIPPQETHVSVVELIRYITNNKTTDNAVNTVIPTLVNVRAEQTAILNSPSQANRMQGLGI